MFRHFDHWHPRVSGVSASARVDARSKARASERGEQTCAVCEKHTPIDHGARQQLLAIPGVGSEQFQCRFADELNWQSTHPLRGARQQASLAARWSRATGTGRLRRIPRGHALAHRQPDDSRSTRPSPISSPAKGRPNSRLASKAAATAPRSLEFCAQATPVGCAIGRPTLRLPLHDGALATFIRPATNI